MRIAEELGVEFEIRNYIKEPPDADEIRSILAVLEDEPTSIVRRDSKFKKLELNPDDYVGNPGAVIEILLKHKQLLQRPVLLKNDRAIIGRPKARIVEFLSS